MSVFVKRCVWLRTRPSGYCDGFDYGEITAEAVAQSDGALALGSPYLVQEYAGQAR